ncbi:MAG: hypothetical protein Q8T08_03345, partial [Ignavibacteria bacterium]|nr:hypothetical protein [Ignavibacteria bacterium]
MKASKGIYILFIVFFIFSSCKELFVTTKVNKDGSFTRIITITGDSAEVVNATTPYPTDSLWERQFSRDSVDASKFILTYSKHYKNDEILNTEIMNDTSKMSYFSRKIEVSKQFGFFYSYLRFEETYEAFNPFPNMDYKKYLSNEDLDLLSGITKIYSPADSLKLENARENQENLLYAGATKEILVGLKEGVSRLNDA